VVAGGVLYLLFLRVFDTVTPRPADSALVPPVTAVDPMPPVNDPVSSATGSIPLPPDSNAPTPTTPTTPGVTSETPVRPEKWPESFPDLGEHKVVSFEDGPERRWVIDLPGGAQLAAGGFLADMQERGWKVTTVTTPNTVTSVASLESSRASVTLRSGDPGLAAGWSRMEVVYLERLPDFDIPSVTPPTDEEAARKRS